MHRQEQAVIHLRCRLYRLSGTRPAKRYVRLEKAGPHWGSLFPFHERECTPLPLEPGPSVDTGVFASRCKYNGRRLCLGWDRSIKWSRPLARLARILGYKIIRPEEPMPWTYAASAT